MRLKVAEETLTESAKIDRLRFRLQVAPGSKRKKENGAEKKPLDRESREVVKGRFLNEG